MREFHGVPIELGLVSYLSSLCRKMDIHIYEEYKRAIALGKKRESADAIKRFVSSFVSSMEKAEWTKWYLENEIFGHKIRHELYKDVIFPSLLEGYKKAKPWCLQGLIRTMQNLYSSEELWRQIALKSDHQLVLELANLCPDDEGVRKQLLKRQIDYFSFCVHEWPAGILYGMDGADVEQCDEILDAVAIARKLDLDHEYDEFLGEFETKVVAYRARRVRYRETKGGASLSD